MKIILLALFCCAFPVFAQTSGTVVGIVGTTDSRSDPYVGALVGPTPPGARWTNRFGGNPGRIGNAEIRLIVCRPTLCVTHFGYFTADNGKFIIPWTSPVPPISMSIDVVLRRKPVVAGDPNVPFSVIVRSSAGNDIFLPRFTVPSIPSDGIVITGITFPASEEINAYITADEAVRTMVNETGVTSWAHQSYRNLTIDVNSTLNVTPFADAIWIIPSRATTFPFTIPHEMGHAAHWRAHGFAQAEILPTDYFCDGFGSSWGAFTSECERAAFADGFADFMGAMWMWNAKVVSTNNLEATPRFGVAGESFYAPGLCCSTYTDGHYRPMCNTKSLWRTYRASWGSLARVMSTMTAYQRFCPLFATNHCANEGYDPPLHDADSVNWFDFMWNWETNGGNIGIETISSLMCMTGSEP
jgi:hypothetical protein